MKKEMILMCTHDERRQLLSQWKNDVMVDEMTEADGNEEMTKKTKKPYWNHWKYD